MDNYTQGNFSFLPQEKIMLDDMYQAIENQNKVDYWKLIREFSGESFMLSNEQWLIDLCHICEPSHSGTSFCYTLRHMEYIAKNGWTKYIETFISFDNIPESSGDPLR